MGRAICESGGTCYLVVTGSTARIVLAAIALMHCGWPEGDFVEVGDGTASTVEAATHTRVVATSSSPKSEESAPKDDFELECDEVEEIDLPPPESGSDLTGALTLVAEFDDLFAREAAARSTHFGTTDGSAPQVVVKPEPAALLGDQIRANEDFETGRTLKLYTKYFPKTFSSKLFRLDRREHWMDIGAGDCNAARDFLSPSSAKLKKKKCGVSNVDSAGRSIVARKRRREPNTGTGDPLELPRVTAISYAVDESDPPPKHPRLTVITGRLFEDIPNDELRTANVITDVFGVSSYTSKLDVTLQKYVNLLRRNGAIYIWFGEPRTTIVTVDGRRLSVEEWLKDNKTIRSVVVSTGDKSICKTVRISRIPKVVPQIPKLKLLAVTIDTPPFRTFVEIPSAGDVSSNTSESPQNAVFISASDDAIEPHRGRSDIRLESLVVPNLPGLPVPP